MNRSQLKLNAKNVLKTNYPSACLFCLIYYFVTGYIGAEIAFVLTLIFYKPSDYSFIIEKIGFSENNITVDILNYIALIASILLIIVFCVFFVGPLKAAKSNCFIKARKDAFKALDALDVLRNERYEKTLTIMLARNIAVFAGYLIMIIPGIYLSYVFCFVPYIAAENPNIGWKEALRKSSEMTNGHKLELLALNLSFTGWFILSFIIPIFGKYFVIPYYDATYTEVYESLKNS